MELPIAAILVTLVIAWGLHGVVRQYARSRQRKQAYDRELQRVLSDPNSQVKGRYE